MITFTTSILIQFKNLSKPVNTNKCVTMSNVFIIILDLFSKSYNDYFFQHLKLKFSIMRDTDRYQIYIHIHMHDTIRRYRYAQLNTLHDTYYTFIQLHYLPN